MAKKRKSEDTCGTPVAPALKSHKKLSPEDRQSRKASKQAEIAERKAEKAAAEASSSQVAKKKAAIGPAFKDKWLTETDKEAGSLCFPWLQQTHDGTIVYCAACKLHGNGNVMAHGQPKAQPWKRCSAQGEQRRQ